MVADGLDSPTEFEVVMATAFLFFKAKNPDYVVLEVGMGGIGDATNVIEKPLASVITSIGFDHMHVLGDTLAEIAVNKAGIIKAGCPVISNVKDHDAAAVIARKAYEAGSRLYDVSKIRCSTDWISPEGMQVSCKITEQCRKLGDSCDWERERFTMDDGCNKAVRHFFVQLYNKGLIYRGNRLINWCPQCGTSLSDAEVEHEDQTGSYWYFRYPGADGGEGIVVATSRPETMFGDVAIAVHPSDERYKDLVGKNVILPLVGKEIPVITDIYPDPEKGTREARAWPQPSALCWRSIRCWP